jgi:hypothetical protein
MVGMLHMCDWLDFLLPLVDSAVHILSEDHPARCTNDTGVMRDRNKNAVCKNEYVLIKECSNVSCVAARDHCHAMTGPTGMDRAVLAVTEVADWSTARSRHNNNITIYIYLCKYGTVQNCIMQPGWWVTQPHLF